MATAIYSVDTREDLLVPPAMTRELYRKLLTVFYIEERMKMLVKQGKCSFQASTRGHEKLQTGMTNASRGRTRLVLHLLPVARQSP